jgi:hypothetical protein
MDYLKAYSKLINNAQHEIRNKKESYYELHHIIPKCQGGQDDSSNLVLLTAREHFIAHMLLWRNDRTNYKLFAPLLYFKQHRHVKNSRTYQEIRIIHSEFMALDNPSKYLSDSSKLSKSIKLSNYAKNRTSDHNKKLSDAAKGKQKRLGAILEEDSKKLIGASLKEYYAIHGVSDETKEKLRLSSTGRKHSIESLEKQRNKALARPRKKCQICGKENLDAGNYTQHINRHKAKGEYYE